MEIIALKRRNGKTKILIEKSYHTGAYIVCLNSQTANEIAIQSRGMGLNIPFPITFQEFLNGSYYSKGVKKLLIDNADILLQSIAKETCVEAITVTLD